MSEKAEIKARLGLSNEQKPKTVRKLRVNLKDLFKDTILVEIEDGIQLRFSSQIDDELNVVFSICDYSEALTHKVFFRSERDEKYVSLHSSFYRRTREKEFVNSYYKVSLIKAYIVKYLELINDFKDTSFIIYSKLNLPSSNGDGGVLIIKRKETVSIVFNDCSREVFFTVTNSNITSNTRIVEFFTKVVDSLTQMQNAFKKEMTRSGNASKIKKAEKAVLTETIKLNLACV